jgi:hypothetical protein
VAALYVTGHRQQHALATLAESAAAEPEAAGNGTEGVSRPGDPPVGSKRGPGTRSTSSRGAGRTSRARRQTQAGEADA